MLSGFPPELIEQIFGFQADDPTTLKSGVLVARSWTTPCQRVLYRHVTVTKVKSFKSLVRTLEATPELRPLVREITFNELKATRPPSNRPLGRLFPALQAITFLYMRSFLGMFFNAPNVKSIHVESDLPVLDPDSTLGFGLSPTQWALENIHCTGEMVEIEELLRWIGDSKTLASNSLTSATLQIHYNRGVEAFVNQHSSLQHLALHDITSDFQPINAINLQSLTLYFSDAYIRFQRAFGMIRESNLPSLKVLKLNYTRVPLSHVWGLLTIGSIGMLDRWALPQSLAEQLETVVLFFNTDFAEEKWKPAEYTKVRALLGVANRPGVLSIRHQFGDEEPEDIPLD